MGGRPASVGRAVGRTGGAAADGWAAGRLRRRRSAGTNGLIGVEDEPQRLHVGGAVGERPLHGDLPAGVLVCAGSTDDADRKWLAEVGLTLEFDLAVPEHHGAMTHHVVRVPADRDPDAVQVATINQLAVLEVGRALHDLVTGAGALLAEVDDHE